MRCIKCLNNLKKCRLIFGLCSLLLSFSFCLSGLLSQSVSALTWSYGTITGSYYYTGNSDSGGQVAFNFNNSRTATFTLPSKTRMGNVILDFSAGTDFNSNIKPRLSGSQYYTVSFYLGCNGAQLNSVGTVSYALPVITDIRVSYSSDHTFQRIYGYDPDSNEFVYPSNGTYTESFDNYLVSISGYVPNSQNWDGKLILGGSVLINNNSVQAVCDIGAPTLNLYDSEATQIQGSIDNQTQQQEQYHDETQQTFDDAQDTADSDSDDSSSQATSSGTTLLAGFTSFLGALTNATPSNCVIDGNIGDFRMGNIDLCQLDPPPAFQAISSIMVIGFTVPLSIALGRKMISLFRSFQG